MNERMNEGAYVGCRKLLYKIMNKDRITLKSVIIYTKFVSESFNLT